MTKRELEVIAAMREYILKYEENLAGNTKHPLLYSSKKIIDKYKLNEDEPVI